MANACRMINRCFRHQHPEAFDRPEVSEPPVPAELRYGQDVVVPVAPLIPEEPMGDPDAIPIYDTVAYG